MRWGRIVVLDLVGSLDSSYTPELGDRIKRLIECGERIVVFNLMAVTTVDDVGLGELVRSVVTVLQRGGAIQLVNAPTQFREYFSGKFL